MTAPVTLLASATRTADGAAASVDCEDYSTLRLTLTAVRPGSGARFLRLMAFKVYLEHSSDDATWRPLHTFGTKALVETGPNLPDPTATQTERVTLSGFDRYVRARWVCHDLTAPGEASMTFGIAGDAVEGVEA